jgi:quercetin dioxygenase-like cupin family protein
MDNSSPTPAPVQQTATYVRWDEVPVEPLNPLLSRQVVVGTNIMVARVLLKKGSIVPMHQHYNEQVAYIESGALQFTIEGKQVTVRAGECLCIPPNVPHSALALEDTVDIDYFNPPREDWLNKTDDYLRG